MEEIATMEKSMEKQEVVEIEVIDHLEVAKEMV